MDFTEIIKISLNAIRANKLRSILTLLGIVVGVFSIIGVMTAVDVLQNSIESGMSNLGAHTFQIQKFPVMASRQQWLKARNRKDITYEQASKVEDRITTAMYVGIEAFDQGNVVQALTGEKTNPNVLVFGETPNGIPTNNWAIREGRSISNDDFRNARKVVILGRDIVSKVFPRGDAVGSEVKINGVRYSVIGNFEPKGASLGGPNENYVAIPLSAYQEQFGTRRSLNIMIKAKSPELYEDCLEEARMILRTVRKVPPGAEDDFSVFSNDSMIEQFNSFTQYVKLGVGFISFVSLLAAGVGIMNIMLVSVSERIKEIGIRKAIGARKKNILSQFLTEAIVLCQIGGILGILVGILMGNLVALMFEVPPVFPLDWAILGFVICSLVGVIFGVYPAWKAANLDPIEALRYE
ncbi:MAG: ABC transporter permease [Ignavibacteriales bacterium]|nr:ABC transporter permease [Ignavibacteriales bacterium]